MSHKIWLLAAIALFFNIFPFNISPCFSQGTPFVIHIARETISIGDPEGEGASSRPSGWPAPLGPTFEKKFNIPFPVKQNAELHLEVLGVNSSKNYVEINGEKMGALFPDGGMTFVPSLIIIPAKAFVQGENTITIEADEGVKDEDHDNFLMKNIELLLYTEGQLPVSDNNARPEELVTLPSIIDVIEGDEFSLQLVCSTNEGYKWQLQNYDKKLLNLVAEQQPRVYDNQGRLEQQFDFLALLPGTVKLEFRKFYPSTGELAVMDSQSTEIRIYKQIILTGTVQECSIPQLGTHQLVADTGNILCILRTKNNEINFNDYMTKKVTIVGRKENEEIPDFNGLILMVKSIILK